MKKFIQKNSPIVLTLILAALFIFAIVRFESTMRVPSSNESVLFFKSQKLSDRYNILATESQKEGKFVVERSIIKRIKATHLDKDYSCPLICLNDDQCINYASLTLSKQEKRGTIKQAEECLMEPISSNMESKPRYDRQHRAINYSVPISVPINGTTIEN